MELPNLWNPDKTGLFFLQCSLLFTLIDFKIKNKQELEAREPFTNVCEYYWCNSLIESKQGPA